MTALSRIATVLVALIGLLTIFSCVKDVDLDQAEEVTLRPVVDLNLVFFNLEGGRFYDLNTNTAIPTVRDTTEIRFLDDPDLAESIRRVDFLTRFSNSIPRDFLVTYRFISEASETTFTFENRVPMGIDGQPTLVEFLEVIENEDVQSLTMSNRLVVEVTIDGADPVLTGTIELESATTYYLEITERE